MIACFPECRAEIDRLKGLQVPMEVAEKRWVDDHNAQANQIQRLKAELDAAMKRLEPTEFTARWRRKYASMFLGTIDSIEQPVRNKEIIEACKIIERQAKVISELEALVGDK